MTYVLPPYDPANPQSALTVSLSIESLAAAETASGPFGRPLSRGAALAAWQHTVSSASVPAGPPPSGGVPPAILGWHGAAGGGQRLTFNAGRDPSAKVISGLDFPFAGLGQAAITAPPSQVVPGIATAGYLAANRLGIGSVIPVSLGGFSVPVRIVASVADFPTVFGQSRTLVADLAEVNDLLVANQVTPLAVTRWWLRTDDGPAAAAGLLAGIGLAQLMVPAITLTADATAPVPWVLVILPLGPAIALALVTAAVPVAAAALSVLHRPDPAAQLRSEAG